MKNIDIPNIIYMRRTKNYHIDGRRGARLTSLREEVNRNQKHYYTQISIVGELAKLVMYENRHPFNRLTKPSLKDLVMEKMRSSKYRNKTIQTERMSKKQTLIEYSEYYNRSLSVSIREYFKNFDREFYTRKLGESAGTYQWPVDYEDRNTEVSWPWGSS